MERLTIDLSRIFEAHPFAREVLESLEDHGHEAVIVGGIVRDAVRDALHEHIVYDPIEVDIATTALPNQIKEIFGDYKLVEVGEAFGVIIVRSTRGVDYEIATYRTESEYDGRKPGFVQHVRDLKHDVLRRDFTINGLAVGLDGVVIDHVGGIEDLQNHIIRTIGDPDSRFNEDYLRMLRAVRFSSTLSAPIEQGTRDAIRRHAHNLNKISAERIQDELVRMLASTKSGSSINLLDEVGLLDVILPEFTQCKGVDQPPEYHPEGDVFTHTLLAMELADKVITDPRVKLAVLLHDIGKPEALHRNEGVNAAGHDVIGAEVAREICRRLRFSNEDSELIVSLIAEHQRIGHFPSMNLAKQVRFLQSRQNDDQDISKFGERFSWFKSLLQLMIVDCQASAMKSSGWLSALKSVQPLLLHIEDLEKRVGAHDLINGNDLIELGVPKGPAIGQLLDELYEKIYAGEIASKEEALEEAKQLIGLRNKN